MKTKLYKTCLLKFAMLSLISILQQGCLFDTSGGNGSVSTSQGPGTDIFTNPTITISAIYPSTQNSNWVPDSSLTDSLGRLYIRGNNLSIYGTCSRGVAKVKVSSGGAFFPEEAICDEQGIYTYTRAFASASEDNFELGVTPILVDGTAVVASAILKSVRIDDLAPAAPAILSPSSVGTYFHSGLATVTISGTNDSQTYKINGPENSIISPSGSSWTVDVVLNSGTTTTYSFSAVDRAGNQSAASSISITYTPSISVKISGGYLGSSSVTNVATGYSMESNVYINPQYVVDSNTNYSIDLGLNRIVNQVRSDQ